MIPLIQKKEEYESQGKVREVTRFVEKTDPFPTSFYNDIIQDLSTRTLMSTNDVEGRVFTPVKAQFQEIFDMWCDCHELI